MDCSSPSSSVHGISQSRILEWLAMPSSRGSSWPRVWIQSPVLVGRFFTTELPEKSYILVWYTHTHTYMYTHTHTHVCLYYIYPKAYSLNKFFDLFYTISLVPFIHLSSFPTNYANLNLLNKKQVHFWAIKKNSWRLQ